jgi:hypothetical protein
MATAGSLSLRIDNADLSVIDVRAPRFNQTVVAVGVSIGVVTGFWPLLLVLGAQLAVTVLFGRKYCVPCLFYFEVIQPRLGPGKVEDSRAPRFANVLGAIFLLAASAAYATGFTAIGFGLGAMVAVLASLAATTGLCVGCEVYRVIAKLRGVRGGSIDQLDVSSLGASVSEGAVVLFTHPLCSDCQTLGTELDARGAHVVRVDVSKRRDLAKKYGVSIVPLAVEVDAGGRVKRRVA